MPATQFFSNSIDLGQIILAAIIGLVGWFIKREITRISAKIEAHDTILFQLNGHVQRLIGREESRIRKISVDSD